MQFKEIPGQKKIKQRLINTVKENRISHAQLFLGPEGSGKLPMAIAYAQYICCTNKQEDDSCGECPSCKKINNLAHPDLHFLFPVVKQGKSLEQVNDYLPQWREFLIKNNSFVSLNQWHNFIDAEKKQSIISTNDANELVRVLSMNSYESEYKVMIIWMAERFYHSAAPKILKILEEPSPKTLFILISEDQEKLLKTIRSRTQLLKFTPYDDEDVSRYLQSHYNKEAYQTNAVSVLAEGNIARAIMLLDEDIDNSFNYTEFRNWMLLCYKPRFTDLKVLVDKLATLTREKQKEFLKYGIQLIRNSLLINYENTDLIKAVEEEKKFVFNFAKLINDKNAVEFIDLFNEAIFHIERNANAKILFMDVSFKSMQAFKMK
jgi:DNA polymerase III subunit delta'